MMLIKVVAVLAALALASNAIFVPGKGSYITIDEENDTKLWSWLFEAENVSPTSANTPFILWLTGGPGCSGSLAALSENGPYHVGPHLELIKNPYSWNNNANTLYLDQPFGVGFSVDPESSYINSTVTAAADVCTFLKGFFAENPVYAEQPFFVSCESYGGHWCPAVGAAMLADADNCGSKAGLHGVSIGNGMVDPEAQFPGYSQYFAEYDLVSKSVADKAADMEKACVKDIKEKSMVEAYETCLPIIQFLMENTDIDGQGPVNPYNRNLPCNAAENGPLCYNFTAPTDYLNLEAVQAALGVNPTVEWATCNFGVNGHFTTDWVTSYNYDLVDILKADVPVTVYNGQLDTICNYIGALYAAQDAAPDANFGLTGDKWYIGSKAAGEVQTYKNFNLVWVYGAGHLVPADQPAAALVIIDNLINGNKPFNTTSSA